jgi:hypothetical protein
MVKEGFKSLQVQAASWSWTRQGNGFSGDPWDGSNPPELKDRKFCYLIHEVCDNLLQQQQHMVHSSWEYVAGSIFQLPVQLDVVIDFWPMKCGKTEIQPF